jgi:hypothetical protein
VKPFASPGRPRALHRRSQAGLVFACLTLGSSLAVATDYEFNPRVELGAGYDSNVNLGASGDEISSSDLMADARADFIARESNWEWKITPEVRGIYYPSNTDIDSNSEFLYLYGERNGPRYTLQLYADAWSQTLLRSYLPTATIGTGLGVTEPGTTLNVLSDTRENFGYIDPHYALQVTERQRVELEVNYTDASFNHTEVGGYTDYRNVAGAADWVIQATPTGSFTLRGRAQSFQPDQALTTDTYGGELEWDGKLSPNRQYYLRLGGSRSSFSGAAPAAAAGEPPITNVPSATAITGGAGAQWTFQVTELFLDATRDVEPTGLGYAVDRNQLRLRLERRFTPRLAGFLGGRVIYDDPVRNAVLPDTARNQHYNYATTGFEWRVRQQWSVIGAYEYTSAHYTASAESNAVRLSVVYEPKRPADGPAITVGY